MEPFKTKQEWDRFYVESEGWVQDLDGQDLEEYHQYLAQYDAITLAEQIERQMNTEDYWRV